MSSDLVLVTGASGYVASRCILRLIEDGYRVRGTLRSLRRADEVRGWLAKGLGSIDPGAALSFVQAELTDSAGWDAATADARYVLHVASPIPPTTPKNADDLIVPARDGTLNVMRAASRAEVERVVQTSSLAAIFYGRDNPNDHVYTEADWTDPNHRDNSSYTRSKTVAEQAAWDELPRLGRQLQRSEKPRAPRRKVSLVGPHAPSSTLWWTPPPAWCHCKAVQLAGDVTLPGAGHGRRPVSSNASLNHLMNHYHIGAGRSIMLVKLQSGVSGQAPGQPCVARCD
jgi:hypothetical protein